MIPRLLLVLQNFHERFQNAMLSISLVPYLLIIYMLFLFSQHYVNALCLFCLSGYRSTPLSEHFLALYVVMFFNSGQGETVTSILIDLNGFWTYENRELLVQDVNNE